MEKKKKKNINLQVDSIRPKKIRHQGAARNASANKSCSDQLDGIRPPQLARGSR